MPGQLRVGQAARDPSRADPGRVHATSVTSVKLTATASIATTAKWTPPSAAETVAVTAAAARAPRRPEVVSSLPPETTLPLGPVPNLNSVSSSLIGAGNAAGLFPAIIPSATPSSSPGIPAAGRQAECRAGLRFLGARVRETGTHRPGGGLIALAVAIMLTVTRLSLRKRFRSRKQGADPRDRSAYPGDTPAKAAG